MDTILSVKDGAKKRKDNPKKWIQMQEPNIRFEYDMIKINGLLDKVSNFNDYRYGPPTFPLK